MVDINFSIYGANTVLEDHQFLLQKFEHERHVNIQVSRMDWDKAWANLLNFSLHGGSPDISHIGSIWTSSLAGMEVLRPFNPLEMKSMGGSEAFYQPCWDNSLLTGQSKAWAIPFGAYVYIILYRRDALQKAGIDEQTAFTSETALLETIQRLRASGVHSPFTLASGETPYRPRVHIAVSWVWSAGGDYISADGQNILFDQPEALRGLKNFFELYRQMARTEYNLPHNECRRRLAEGDTAITIVGGDSLADTRRLAKGDNANNIGIAALPGASWVGGANLVVWKETHLNMQKEQAALALTQYLTSYESQLKYANAIGSLPARMDVLPHVQYAFPGVNAIFDSAVRNGRTYHPVRLWVRFLGELSNTFDRITAEILDDTSRELDQTLAKHLKPLAEKFRLVLQR